jgi:hypothetical protein
MFNAKINHADEASSKGFKAIINRHQGPRSGNFGRGREALKMWSGSRLGLAISSTDYPEQASLLERHPSHLAEPRQVIVL